MKLLSWNVNGLRAVLKKGFEGFVRGHNPDILCLQETKAHPHQVDITFSHDYEIFWNSAVRPGYSGTAIFTKEKPLNVTNGIGIPEHDNEGRVLTLEFPDFYLMNVYTPNAGDELKRLPYRVEWDKAFLKYVKCLEQKKPIIFCGDLNVAHQEIDLARPDANRGNAGFTDEERKGFCNIIDAGFLDTFRFLYPDKAQQYSWWTYRAGARERNVGWRIDYFCLSPKLKDLIKDAFIRPEVMGSDHCPVGILLKG